MNKDLPTPVFQEKDLPGVKGYLFWCSSQNVITRFRFICAREYSPVRYCFLEVAFSAFAIGNSPANWPIDFRYPETEFEITLRLQEGYWPNLRRVFHWSTLYCIKKFDSFRLPSPLTSQSDWCPMSHIIFNTHFFNKIRHYFPIKQIIVDLYNHKERIIFLS